MIKPLKKIKTAKANPKKRCKTIRVKRKVLMGPGKKPRILRVKRKICNPIRKNAKDYTNNLAYKKGYDLGFDYGHGEHKNPYTTGSDKWKSFIRGSLDGDIDGGLKQD